MTTDRDFDRLARAWLAIGPNETPDGTVAAVLRDIESMPQVRRPFGSIDRRAFRIAGGVLVAGAMAVLVAVVGGLLLTGSASVGAPVSSSSPNPTASRPASVASPIPPGGPVRAGFQATWLGSHRALPNAESGAGTTITIDATTFSMTQPNAASLHPFRSSASAPDDERLRLETTGIDAACQVGDVGVYEWALSPDGRRLTITAESDDCAVRSAAAPGTWWLAACRDAATLCLGDLAAGTYASAYIVPRLDAGAPFEASFGALTYSVPDGWANASDWPRSFSLVPSSVYARSCRDPLCTFGGPDWTSSGIFLFWQPVPGSSDAPCDATAGASTAGSLDSLARLVAIQPGIDASVPTAITVDGHPGLALDLRVDPSTRPTCPRTTTLVSDGRAVSIGRDERQRLILLDLGGSDVIGILIHVAEPAGFEGFVADATSIVESFRFK